MPFNKSEELFLESKRNVTKRWVKDGHTKAALSNVDFQSCWNAITSVFALYVVIPFVFIHISISKNLCTYFPFPRKV